MCRIYCHLFMVLWGMCGGFQPVWASHAFLFSCDDPHYGSRGGTHPPLSPSATNGDEYEEGHYDGPLTEEESILLRCLFVSQTVLDAMHTKKHGNRCNCQNFLTTLGIGDNLFKAFPKKTTQANQQENQEAPLKEFLQYLTEQDVRTIQRLFDIHGDFSQEAPQTIMENLDPQQKIVMELLSFKFTSDPNTFKSDPKKDRSPWDTYHPGEPSRSTHLKH